MFQFLIFGGILAFSGIMFHNTKGLEETFNDTKVMTPVSDKSALSLYENDMPSFSQQQEYAKFYDAILNLLDDANKNVWDNTLKLNAKTFDVLTTKSFNLTLNEAKANFKFFTDALSLILKKPVTISDVKSANKVLTIKINNADEYNVSIPYLARVAHAL